jgi:predicted nucleic acid-binding protein
MIVYVESSAAAPLIKEEAASERMREVLASLEDEGHLLVTSRLTETELRRMSLREDIPQTLVSGLLQNFDVIEPSAAHYHQAGVLQPRSLRSLDALHVSVALSIDAQVMVSLDERIERACNEIGMPLLDLMR